MYNFSSLIKSIKPYTLNPRMANEELVNDFIAPLILAGNIKHRNGSEYILDKARVSNLMSCKSDVPNLLRTATERIGIQEKMIFEFEDTIDFLFSEESITNMIESVCGAVEKGNNLSKEEKEAILSMKDDVAGFLTNALIIAIRTRNTMGKKVATVFSCGANFVDVIEDDIFRYGFNNRKKCHNIVVIPVNSSFDTVITRKWENESLPLVAATTLHGQWIERLLKAGVSIDELDNMINDSIKKRNIKPLETTAGGKNSKQINYPIGSLIPIEYGNATYYLLVTSCFDENNTAHSSVMDIEKALVSLLEFYDIYGQGDSMYIPLIGTGRSRTGMTYQNAYDLIKRVVEEHSYRIQGQVHLVVTKDVKILY